MMESFRGSSNSFSSSTDTNFLISDLLIPLKKEEKEEKTEISITSFCCYICNFLNKCIYNN